MAASLLSPSSALDHYLLKPARSLPESRRCQALIDLGRLRRNVAHIRQTFPRPIHYLAVIKANAYGHGAAVLAPVLLRSGADSLGVANVQEAIELRMAGISSSIPILVMGPALPEEYPLLAEYDLTAILSCPEEMEAIARIGLLHGKPIPVHAVIDTGIGREGIWHEVAAAFLEKLLRQPGLELRGLFTHFASAEIDPAFTLHQRRVFLDLLEPFLQRLPRDILIHCDNSNSLGSLPLEGPFNAIRIGLLQLGVKPNSIEAPELPDLQPILELHSRIGLVRELPAGTGISYSRTHILHRPSRVALVTAGYADGLPTKLSNRGEVLIQGRRCPILGRITMDITMVDVTDLPHAPAPGEAVIFVGAQGTQEITAAELASWSGCVLREVFTTLGRRVNRVYQDNEALESFSGE